MNEVAVITKEFPVVGDKEEIFEANVTTLVEQAGRVPLVIETDEIENKVTDLLSMISKQANGIEADRKIVTRGLVDAKKEIDSRYSEMKAPLVKAIAVLKERLRVYKVEKMKAEQARQAAERKRIEDEALANAAQAEQSGDTERVDRAIEQGAADAADLPTVVSTVSRGNTGASSGLAKQMKFELVDIVALAKAHPDLVIVNESAINQLIRRKHNPITEIAGLRIFPDYNVRVR